MSRTNNRSGKDDKEPRRFTFSFSTTGLISLTVVAAAALTWVFILGVLVGRGYKPEQAVPQLAEIMPRTDANATKPEKPGVLKAEELDFHEALGQKPSATPSQVKTPAPKQAKDVTPKAAAPQAPKVQAPQPATDQPVAQGQVFDYVYQVGSLKNPEMAAAFSKKLQGIGFKTQIQTAQAAGATWHRILILFRGTPEQADALKQTLHQAGVEKPLQKSKTPR